MKICHIRVTCFIFKLIGYKNERHCKLDEEDHGSLVKVIIIKLSNVKLILDWLQETKERVIVDRAITQETCKDLSIRKLKALSMLK